MGDFRSLHNAFTRKTLLSPNLQTLHGGPFKIMTASVRAQPQTTFFEAAWIRAQVGAGEGKANALGGQCAGALAGLAHLRGFKGRKG